MGRRLFDWSRSSMGAILWYIVAEVLGYVACSEAHASRFWIKISQTCEVADVEFACDAGLRGLVMTRPRPETIRASNLIQTAGCDVDRPRGNSAMLNSEVLLVGATPPVAAGNRWKIVSRVSPDVLVLRADLAALPELVKGARYAISRVADGSLRTIGDEKALDTLDPGTRLFVEAWRDCPSQKVPRPGEGLPWDAPGFQPPGPPTPRSR